MQPGSGSAQCVPPSPGRNYYVITPQANHVTCEPSGALAERSGSEHWPEQAARVRAVSARLEAVQAVQKVLTDSSQTTTAAV
jgi:hypothetical protein